MPRGTRGGASAYATTSTATSTSTTTTTTTVLAPMAVVPCCGVLTVVQVCHGGAEATPTSSGMAAAALVAVVLLVLGA